MTRTFHILAVALLALQLLPPPSAAQSQINQPLEDVCSDVIGGTWTGGYDESQPNAKKLDNSFCTIPCPAGSEEGEILVGHTFASDDVRLAQTPLSCICIDPLVRVTGSTTNDIYTDTEQNPCPAEAVPNSGGNCSDVPPLTGGSVPDCTIPCTAVGTGGVPVTNPPGDCTVTVGCPGPYASGDGLVVSASPAAECTPAVPCDPADVTPAGGIGIAGNVPDCTVAVACPEPHASGDGVTVSDGSTTGNGCTANVPSSCSGALGSGASGDLPFCTIQKDCPGGSEGTITIGPIPNLPAGSCATVPCSVPSPCVPPACSIDAAGAASCAADCPPPTAGDGVDTSVPAANCDAGDGPCETEGPSCTATVPCQPNAGPGITVTIPAGASGHCVADCPPLTTGDGVAVPGIPSGSECAAPGVGIEGDGFTARFEVELQTTAPGVLVTPSPDITIKVTTYQRGEGDAYDSYDDPNLLLTLEPWLAPCVLSGNEPRTYKPLPIVEGEPARFVVPGPDFPQDAVGCYKVSVTSSTESTSRTSRLFLPKEALLADAAGASVADLLDDDPSLSTPLLVVKADTVPPTTPADAQAVGQEPGKVLVSWDASTDDMVAGDKAGAVSRYEVYRNATSSSDYVLLAAVAHPTVSYTDAGLVPDVAYTYTVRAVDASGNPSAPTGSLDAVAQDQVAPSLAPVLHDLVSPPESWTQLDLTWDAASDNSGSIDHYVVYRGTSPGGPRSLLASGGCEDLRTARSCSDTGLTTDTTYYYNVSAVDAAGNSVSSNVVSAAPRDQFAPDQVTGLTAVADPSRLDAINLTWSAAADRGVGVAHYRVYRSTAADGEKSLVASGGCSSLGNVLSCSDTGLTPGTTYFYNVSAVDGSADANEGPTSGDASDTPRDQAGPSVPPVLGVPFSPPASWTQLNLTWSAANDAGSAIARYRVYRGTSPGGPRSLLASGGCENVGTNLSCSDTGLTTDTAYYYSVSAMDATGHSVSSNVVSAAPRDQIAPTKVTGFTVTADPAKTNTTLLSWTAATDQETGVASYRVYRGTTANGARTLVAAGGCANLGNAASCTDSGLTPGTTYFYNVSAVDASANANEGPRSNGASALVGDYTLPTAVTGLNATALRSEAGAQSIRLTWNASTDNIAVDHYEVYRNLTLGFTPGPNSFLGTVPGTSYADAGVAPPTTYRYRVRAVDAAGNLGAFSAEANAMVADLDPPSAIASLAATNDPRSAAKVNLTWTAATDNIAVDHYRILRGASPGSLAFLQDVGPATLRYNDTAVTAFQTYHYRVLAVDAAGLAGASPVVNATAGDFAAPTQVVNLAAAPKPASDSQVLLSWNASSDNVAVANYRVYRGAAAADTLVAAGGCANLGSVVSCTDTGLFPGTAYRYRVRAVDAAGNLGPLSDEVATATRADLTPPAKVMNLQATPRGLSEVALSWNTTADNVGVHHYEVYRGAAAGFTANAANRTGGDVAGTAYVDAGRASTTTYHYKVRAVDAAGNPGPFSAEAHTATPDTTAPGAVSGLTASASTTSTQVSLGWSAAADNVGVHHYEVYRSTASGFSPTAADLAAGAVAGTSYQDAGLAGSTTYHYRVRAVDAAGNPGPFSSQAAATTRAAPANTTSSSSTQQGTQSQGGGTTDTTPPGQVTGLAATASGASQVNLTWTAAADAHRYQVHRGTAAGFTPGAGTLVSGSVAGTSFQDSGRSAGTKYHYKVRAADAAGNLGAFSAEASATTAAAAVPSDQVKEVSVSVVEGGVQVAWTMASPTRNATSFLVWRQSTPTIIATLPATPGATNYSFVDAEFPGGEHTYSVQARYGGSTATAFDAAAPAAPQVTLDVCEVRTADADGDEVCDAKEAQLGTNTTHADTDFDGVPDGTEVRDGTDPLDARSLEASHVVAVPTRAFSEPWLYVGLALFLAVVGVFGYGVVRLRSSNRKGAGAAADAGPTG